jgi:hypothetical protein
VSAYLYEPGGPYVRSVLGVLEERQRPSTGIVCAFLSLNAP